MRAQRELEAVTSEQVRQALESTLPDCRGPSTEELTLEAKREKEALQSRQHALTLEAEREAAALHSRQHSLAMELEAVSVSKLEAAEPAKDHLEVPPSWCRQIEISRDDFNLADALNLVEVKVAVPDSCAWGWLLAARRRRPLPRLAVPRRP